MADVRPVAVPLLLAALLTVAAPAAAQVGSQAAVAVDLRGFDGVLAPGESWPVDVLVHPACAAALRPAGEATAKAVADRPGVRIDGAPRATWTDARCDALAVRMPLVLRLDADVAPGELRLRFEVLVTELRPTSGPVTGSDARQHEVDLPFLVAPAAADSTREDPPTVAATPGPAAPILAALALAAALLRRRSPVPPHPVPRLHP